MGLKSTMANGEDHNGEIEGVCVKGKGIVAKVVGTCVNGVWGGSGGLGGG